MRLAGCAFRATRATILVMVVVAFWGLGPIGSNAFVSLENTKIRPQVPLKPRNDFCLSESTASSVPSTSGLGSSRAFLWHRQRRKQMLEKYGDQIAPLERQDSSYKVALPLLFAGNFILLVLSVCSGLYWNFGQTALAALFPGSILSLWQLQILHDALHGSLLKKGKGKFLGITRSRLQDALLFWGSMPSAFGYHLYLKYGHLSHHNAVGQASLLQLFDSNQADFEDGDVVFVAHRMKLTGPVGPKFRWGKGDKKKTLTMSISKTGFNSWREGHPLRNALVFAASFTYERLMLVINDVIVALTGRNFYFPNKPKIFHQQCANYCRWASALRFGLCAITKSWNPLWFLILAETLWTTPPHPACAMFITNHGSDIDETTGDCIPSRSVYAGKWYSLLTLGTNYHVEHHDFPTIPLHKLGKLRQIAPEFYPSHSNDNVFSIMKQAFAKPSFYACMMDQESIRLAPMPSAPGSQ